MAFPEPGCWGTPRIVYSGSCAVNRLPTNRTTPKSNPRAESAGSRLKDANAHLPHRSDRQTRCDDAGRDCDCSLSGCPGMDDSIIYGGSNSFLGRGYIAVLDLRQQGEVMVVVRYPHRADVGAGGCCLVCRIRAVHRGWCGCLPRAFDWTSPARSPRSPRWDGIVSRWAVLRCDFPLPTEL